MVNAKFGVSADAGKDFKLAMARLLCSDFSRWKILKSNVADPFVKVLRTMSSKQRAAIACRAGSGNAAGPLGPGIKSTLGRPEPIA